MGPSVDWLEQKECKVKGRASVFIKETSFGLKAPVGSRPVQVRVTDEDRPANRATKAKNQRPAGHFS